MIYNSQEKSSEYIDRNGYKSNCLLKIRKLNKGNPF